MRKFKQGTLKDSAGKLVTDRKKAIAIALNEAGVSNKSLQRAEIRNGLLVYKKQLERMLYREMMNEKTIRGEILKLFRQNENVKDSDVHALAERIEISPHELEAHIYAILRSVLGGGKSKGEVKDVDSNELAMGIKVEQEHTDDPVIAEKISRDHLSEDPKYYTKLKTIEGDSHE